MEEFIKRLAETLDPLARKEFGVVDRTFLARSMLAVGMRESPPVVGDAAGERASGDCVCAVCGRGYFIHPFDWRGIGYGNVPFFKVLCNGERVKI